MIPRRLSWWHLVVWLFLGLITSFLAYDSCQQYNQIAGTDLTTAHMVKIALAVFFGPMTGPIANPGAGETFNNQAKALTGALFLLQCLGICPFVLIRNRFGPLMIIFLWILFVASVGCWYFGALVSLGLALF